MTPDVSDWFRSVTVLGIGFVGVIAVTIGLSTILIPAPSGTVVPSAAAGSADASAGAAPPRVAGEIGGTIVVSGDVDTTFRVQHESTDGRYALVGDGGRIFFEGEPLTVAQISFDGLEFFVDPDECSLTPGARDDATGVAEAQLRCDEIEDVRETGVVTLSGTIGVASDLLGLRGDLPPLGGTIAFGDRTLTFGDVAMLHPRFTAVVGQLSDLDGSALVVITYDDQMHSLELAEVTIDGTVTELPPDACDLATTEVGIVNPHARQLEMHIACAPLEIGGLGTVEVSGTLMIEEFEPQF
jgi:hypothetical protein